MTELLPMFLAVIGILAFLVSAIVEVIKKPLAKIPTDLVVIILSIALSVLAFFAYVAMYNVQVMWYMIVAAVIGGFIVAFVAMFGWDKLTALFQRFKKE